MSSSQLGNIIDEQDVKEALSNIVWIKYLHKHAHLALFESPTDLCRIHVDRPSRYTCPGSICRTSAASLAVAAALATSEGPSHSQMSAG